MTARVKAHAHFRSCLAVAVALLLVLTWPHTGAHARGHIPPNNQLCAIGDSITAQQFNQLQSWGANYIINESSNRGYNDWMAALSRQRVLVPPANNFGHSGDTTSDVLARMGPIVLAKCGVYIVLVGVNDIKNGVATADIEANLQAIWTMLTDTGAVVIGSTILPFYDTTQSHRDQLWLLNTWIKQQHETMSGLWIADPAYAYGDPLDANNSPRSNYSYDGLHPTGPGAYAFGNVYAQFINLLFGDPGDPVSSVTDVYSANNSHGNLLSSMPLNPANTGGSKGTNVSGTVGTGLALNLVTGSGGDITTAPALTATGAVCGYGGSACAVTYPSGDNRVWQQIIVGGSGASVHVPGSGICGISTPCVGAMTSVQLILNSAGQLSNVSTGDQIYGQCVVQIDPSLSYVSGVGLELYWDDGTNQYWTGDMDGISGDVFPNPSSTYEMTLRTPAFTLPTNNVYSYLEILIELTNNGGSSFAPTGTFRVADCALRKF